ncbi:Telomerase protein component 1 [Serendipita sp. 405]|nr:Telomerase protein component 1 [Serendipita sp. 405]
MSSYVRRLVSGHKARFYDKDLDVELDLVYLTDQVVIMGFPAAGLAGFYRNPREEVKRFLDTRHGDKYRVFNFCPTVENSYPSSTFYGRVSRYPFPDHHAPPIGLLALATQEMAAWLARGPDYTIVVHCKAGKGRSGTLACSLLLRLDDAIAPPKLQRSYNASEWADERANEIMHEVESETENQRRTLGEESDIPPTTDAETSADEQESPSSESKKVESKDKPTTGPVSRNSLTVPKEERGTKAASTVEKVLKLHSSRRMRNTKEKQRQGVSIPSQRRWLRYWSEFLHEVAPPQLQLAPSSTSRSPKARLYNVKIRMRDTGGGIQVAVVKVAKMLIDNAPLGYSTKDRGAGDVWVSLARYEDSMVEEIEKRVRTGAPVEYEDDGVTRKDDMFETTKWDDKKMVASFARLGQAHGTKPELTKDSVGNIFTYDLVPVATSDWVDLGAESEESGRKSVPPPETNEGIVLESSREFRIKLYMGQ